MEKFRVGVIGTGGISRYSHVPALKEMDNVEIVALCDSKSGRAADFAKEFELDAQVFTDYKEMIKKVKMDAVHVCTPNYLHAEMSIYAMKAGLNVLCEKPDSVSVEDALLMKETQESTKKTLMVVRNNRFADASKYLKGIIDRGDLGEIYSARCGWQRTRGIPGKGGWFTNKAQSGGGPLIDLGVHMIDLAVYMMGNPKCVSVSGSAYTKFADCDMDASVSSMFGDKEKDGIFDVEDLAMGFIKFDNGACLQIEFSWASNVAEERNFVELRGTKGGVTWENGGASLRIFSEDQGRLLSITPLVASSVSGHPANIAHFYEVIKGDKPIFTMDQGINMLKIICGIYESARTGKEVVI